MSKYSDKLRNKLSNFNDNCRLSGENLTNKAVTGSDSRFSISDCVGEKPKKVTFKAVLERNHLLKVSH